MDNTQVRNVINAIRVALNDAVVLGIFHRSENESNLYAVGAMPHLLLKAF